MYLQHIEKIRQDVAILPVTFLDDPWYLNLLKQGDSFIYNPPEVALNRNEIIHLNSQDNLPDRYEVGIPKTVCREYQIDSSQKIIRLDLEDGWHALQATYSLESMKIVLNLLAENQWRRPVLVSSACDSTWLRQIQNRLQCEGLAFRILPCRSPYQKMDYAWQKIESLLRNPKRFIHYRETSKQFPDTVDSCRKDYFNLAEKLIQHKRLTKDSKVVHEILSLLSDNIGFSYLIAPDAD
jgi:hypothetical protein